MSEEIELYTRENIDTFPWSSYKSLDYEANCLPPFVEQGVSTFIQNVETEFNLLKAGRHVFPITINRTEYHSSYVCSPYTHNISYALEELHNLGNKPIEALCSLILKCLGILLKLGRINQTVHINNWLLSTNLYPDWQGKPIADITNYCQEKWPQHAIVFRSINQCHEQEAFDKFAEAGYHFFLTRQVYVFDGRSPEYLKKINFRRDWQLLHKSQYQWVKHSEIQECDIPRIVDLYRDLYLDKYSYHNPQFTEKYIELCLKKQLLILNGLRNPAGQLDGVIGYFIRNGVMTTPLVGYDRSLPKAIGLYRMLIAIVLQTAANEQVLLNLSAGVASFKRLRGGTGHLEYSTLYLRHLPFYRRLPWHILMCLMNTAGTYVMRKYKL